MSAAREPARHARLFEYLRHQHIGAGTARRLAVERLTRVEDRIRSDHLALALRSWDRPVALRDGLAKSAPEPRRHDEFFRAVRA